MRRAAFISECRRYRFTLDREWSGGLNLLVCMLNPSTADADVDDPTIRRLIKFATRAGFGSLRVVNLFAFRSPDPSVLRQADDPVGIANDYIIGDSIAYQNANNCPVLAAWGAFSLAAERARKVMGLVEGTNWVCLGTTKDGHPRHPLYVPGKQPMVPFAGYAAGGR